MADKEEMMGKEAMGGGEVQQDQQRENVEKRQEGEGGGVSEEDCEEMLLCARYGEVEEMKELIEQGVPISCTDGMGNTGRHTHACMDVPR